MTERKDLLSNTNCDVLRGYGNTDIYTYKHSHVDCETQKEFQRQEKNEKETKRNETNGI